MTDQQPVAKNILQNYYRQPKIYIKLPSQGKFYPPGSLDVSENGEYPVFAMTAKDELMMKTPDALLNGQATVEVIKSCVPAILNPWEMPSIDLDAILVAIRIATYGQEMDVTSECPECKNLNDYIMDLTGYIGEISNFLYQDVISIPPLTVHIRPFNYREITKTAIKAIEQERIFDIVNDTTISDEEKLERFGASFLKITDLTINVIIDTIDKIDTPEGSVSDKKEISEFIKNCPKDVFQSINDHVTKIKNQIELKAQQVECKECNHQFQVAVTMDQANFFAVRS